jgi:hypothetical protein
LSKIGLTPYASYSRRHNFDGEPVWGKLLAELLMPPPGGPCLPIAMAAVVKLNWWQSAVAAGLPDYAVELYRHLDGLSVYADLSH